MSVDVRKRREWLDWDVDGTGFGALKGKYSLGWHGMAWYGLVAVRNLYINSVIPQYSTSI